MIINESPLSNVSKVEVAVKNAGDDPKVIYLPSEWSSRRVAPESDGRSSTKAHGSESVNENGSGIKTRFW